MSSSRSSLRRGAVAAVLALSSSALVGCGAGVNAATNEIRPDHAYVTQGDIEIQNISVVTTEDGEGPAAITARIFNEGTEDETLEAITFASDDGSGEAQLSPAEGGELTVPAGGHLMLGGEGNAAAVIEDAAAQGITDGAAQPLTFELSETGAIEVPALVVPASQLTYSEWGPSQEPTGSPEGAQSPDDGQTPGEEAPGEEQAPDDAEAPAGAETPAGTEAPETAQTPGEAE
ncbi:DUF461 domain-containing protein [Streptomyces sp. JJ66]|uniref:DUF461 domain-containing protein n=1 Tax=Streptomyces sp. JJ66 TaxID=2803843 RepID=UPI001C5A0C65|nr:DUF461 domain-containing protein [Streptomyces sp. JJ66]MBW1604325.1 DUF461 domain-containing protein [Streptomyces sp. JJ66]